MNTEIIVADNNSTDGSCKMIRQKFPEVNLIENKKNIGFAKANNQGVKLAKGEYVLILNPDTLLAEDTLERILDFTEKHEDTGAVGLRFIDGTGNFLPECKRNIPTFKIAMQKILGYSKNYYADHIAEREIQKVDILTGAFMLLKRETYQKVNGFDEDYFMYGEDIDLSFKLLKSGYRNYYFGESEIIHYKGESTVKDIYYLKNFYGAMYVFYKKHFKINFLNNIISRMAVYSMILLKKAGLEEKTNLNEPKNILLISNDPQTLEAIEEKTQFEDIHISENFEAHHKEYDMVIFDNNYLSNKEIIKLFQKKTLRNTSKRIIPKNCNFYIGSDTSLNRGEVVEFK